MIKSRKRMILLIAAVLVIVFSAALGVIYFTTYAKLQSENRDMLTVFADSYAENGFPSDDTDMGPEDLPELTGRPTEDIRPTGEDGPTGEAEPPASDEKPSGNHLYDVSTFYAVAFDTDGSVKEYMNDQVSGLSDDELVATARTLAASGAGYGKGDGIIYLVTVTDTYILVTMMDTTSYDEVIDTLMLNMVVFGGIAILLLVSLSVLLSKWVMKPAADAYEKQKRFISDAGHELKTPIATISANAELLLAEEGQNKWLDNIVYENDRMSGIVHELLDMARLENVKPMMEDVDFSSLCMAAVLPFEAAAFEQGVRFDYEMDDDVHVLGNKADLEKLVGVLTDNAISHCTASGDVLISLKKEHGKAALMVSNTGEAMSKEEMQNIFERFYRKDQARSGDSGHFGLGLSIAKAIVTAHGGSISVGCRDGKVIFTCLL